MTKVIDGKNAVLGRLASYAAKESLKGEEIVILNCDKVIITGNKKDIEKKFEEKRKRIGSGQKGPKHSRTSERIVKRCIRGMIPDHRKGRGKEIYKKIKCYIGIPKEFQEVEKISSGKERPIKFIELKKISKNPKNE